MNRTKLNQVEEQLVRRQRVARLATANQDGDPHVVPVCYAFDGERFFIALDEKKKRVEVTALRRVRNIVDRPRVALLIDHYDDDWTRLAYVLIRGKAVLLGLDDEAHQPAVALLRTRYSQYLSMTLEESLMIAIVPERVTSWASSDPTNHVV
jgi:PPOX class probable F420-dependent enzyme